MAARRLRKSERGINDFKALLDAIKAMKVNKKSRKSTAKAYNIDMRSLGRYVQKFDAAVPDITAVTDDELLEVVHQIASYATPSSVFNEKQEKALVECVVKCAQYYHGLSITDVKQLAYQFALKIDAEHPRSWDEYKMAGKQWYYGFMLRHKKLFLRMPEKTSFDRSKAFCRENVDHFFRNFFPKTFTASSIWNMDETGFSTVPTAPKRGATAENIVAGFRATGICPYDPGVFNDSHFVSLGVDEANSEASAVQREFDKNEQHCIVVDSAPVNIAASEPSTSDISRATSLTSVISSIGPLRAATPQKKSNRGPKPQETTVLTSPENVAVLTERRRKRAAAKEKTEAIAENKKRKASPKKAPKRTPANNKKKATV